MLILSVLLKYNKMLEMILITAQIISKSKVPTSQSKVWKKRIYKLIIYSNIQKKLNLNWATEVQFNTWCISQTALQASLTHSNCMTSAL